eukprot:5284477-Alexandrium_andersonii.AAC.1
MVRPPSLDMALDELIEADKACKAGAVSPPTAPPPPSSTAPVQTAPSEKPRRNGQRSRRPAGKRAEAAAKAGGANP